MTTNGERDLIVLDGEQKMTERIDILLMVKMLLNLLRRVAPLNV